jgi:hypothetical protein
MMVDDHVEMEFGFRKNDEEAGIKNFNIYNKTTLQGAGLGEIFKALLVIRGA